MIPASRLSQVQKASKLMGTPVNNLQDEKLGKVENLLVDLPSGRVVAVIVSSGGFLGMGDELSAVPPTALRFTTDRDTLQLDASKEMLSKRAAFQGQSMAGLRSTQLCRRSLSRLPGRALLHHQRDHGAGQHGAQCSRPQ